MCDSEGRRLFASGPGLAEKTRLSVYAVRTRTGWGCKNHSMSLPPPPTLFNNLTDNTIA